VSEPLRYQHDTKTIDELIALIGLQERWSWFLNLDPGFQRKSVWSQADRRKLIQSILHGFPSKRRGENLREPLAPVFASKDDHRRFSPEVRRILWNSVEKKICSVCADPLDWSSFHVDHVNAHSRGGRTALANAALICPTCNAKKGARRVLHRRWREPHDTRENGLGQNGRGSAA
jgi:5-methylcytosine-specific restriction endonuclease McrA